MNWSAFHEQLLAYPSHVNELAPPCPPERIAEEEARFGTLPKQVIEMVQLFNGGRLFIDAIPFITLFGFSIGSDPSDRDWFLDRYTLEWRRRMNRPNDWVIAMSNYGGMVILEENGHVREWDTAQRRWGSQPVSLEQWLGVVLEQGKDYLQQ